MQDIIIIGGPNGAGKAAVALAVLPGKLDLHEFINADDITAKLSPFDPEGVALKAG